MTEQGKKNFFQNTKRNPEQDQCRVFLESSLNIGIPNFKLDDTLIGKGNKLGEGIKNRVFLSSLGNSQYQFYLGNFNIEQLTPSKVAYSQEENENIKNQDIKNLKNNKTIYTYSLNYGQANLTKSFDISDIREEINSHSIEINPFKTKKTSFKYIISANNSTSNNKLSALKHIEFDIIKPNKCCDCGVENSTENPLIFCQNDNCFFCSQCDKNWHEQKEKKALSLHFRTDKFKYTLSYFGNCPLLGHLNKPFLYFDVKNKTCLCVKCVESLNSEDRVEEDISYIEDYLNLKEKKEDFLNSRIDSVCNDIKKRIKFAENIWKEIDDYEKNYYNELEDKRIESIKLMTDEGYARQTFLSCVFMEIQRIIKEIDSKAIFNKNLRNNVDVSTFLYMNQIYLNYMHKELSSNLELLASTNLESFVKPIISLNENNTIEYQKINLEEFKLNDSYENEL